MYQPTLLTWILIIFGLITCLPLLIAQLIILFEPEGTRAKDILIGKDEEWRDKTHFKSAYSMAMADWIIFAPTFCFEYYWHALLYSLGLFIVRYFVPSNYI